MNPQRSPFRNGFNSRELKTLFREGLLHIVAPAVYGKSNFPVALSLCENDNPARQHGREISKLANAENKTLSLLPHAPISALPIHRQWSKEQNAYSSCIDAATIKRHILEALEIHLQWITDRLRQEHRLSSPVILFAFDQDGAFDVHLAISCLHEICDAPPNSPLADEISHDPRHASFIVYWDKS